MGGIAFQNVGALKPGRTRFDWHFSKKFDTEIGILYPIFCKKVLPGDYWKIDIQNLIRNTPLKRPIMHEVSVDCHFFLVYDRDIDDNCNIPGSGNPAGDPMLLKDTAPPANRFNYELFITGGFNGMDTQMNPKWNPNDDWDGIDTLSDPVGQKHPAILEDPLIGWTRGCEKFSLWDSFGFPVLPNGTTWSSTLMPIDNPRRAYNFIYNMVYRDETAINPVPWNNGYLLCRAWRKDYFTSGLPFQQRGEAPAFPVTLDGVLNANFNIPNDSYFTNLHLPTAVPQGTNINIQNYVPGPSSYFGADSNQSTILAQGYSGPMTNNLLSNNNTIQVGTINTASFDVDDLRYIVQLQKYLERNARAGVRLNEWIYSHFGVNNGDSHLGRPIYIGGTKQPLIISEILQTSETTSASPQGEMSGHGIASTDDEVGSINVKDHGLIIGIMSIMPKPAYCQGINRQFLQETKLDFFTPEFVNLSEQGVKRGELYINNDSTDEELLIYQGMYDEYRTMNSEFTGNFRDTLNDWHLGRIFSTPPVWNGDFITCKPEETRRIFLVQNEPGFLCDIEFFVTAVRPLPEIAEPGLLDHH